MASIKHQLKILRVIGSMDPSQGGPCQGIRNSIPALEKLGAYNEVVSLDDPHANFLHTDAFPIPALGPATGPWGYGTRLLPWLETNLGRFNVVIVHGLWQYYDYAAQKAVTAHKKKGLEDIKLYVMPHGMLDPYFQKAPDRKLKAIRNWFYWKFIEHRVINNSDGILFTCEVELRLARETFVPYKPKAEFNVGYGIQAPPAYQKSMIEQFRKTCNLNENELYFLFLSRIDEKKGVDLLVDAYIKHFRKGFPRLIIAGPGIESPYGQKVKAILQTSMPKRIPLFFQVCS